MQNASKIRSGFDLLAPFYDLLSRIFFGRSIIRSQTYFLPQLRNFKHVLILGGGTGQLLIECLENKTATEYTYVDISEKMIAKAKGRLKKYIQTNSLNEKIEFICGSYPEIPTDKKFELIITPFVLDCFAEKELPEVMYALNEKLAPNGKWLFADFNVPGKGSMKFFSGAIIRMLYFFFNIFCGLGIKKLPAFEKYFESLSFKKEKEKLFLKGILCAKIYSRT